MISPRTKIVNPIADDVLRGLTGTPKTLPPKLFYDAVGSDLFEQITRLPEYYLTRTEQQILNNCSDVIIGTARSGSRPGDGSPPLTLIELGAGSATKTRTLIRATLNAQPTLTFYPLDVSPSALHSAVDHLSEIPGLTVTPVVADYTSGLPRQVIDPTQPCSSKQRFAAKHGGVLPSRKLVLYIGSSIGNFEPMQSIAMLSRIRHSLAPGDALLLGTDLSKDERVLVAAYDDAAGVTAAFNKNILARINRELGGHFDTRSFRHLALWNGPESRIEMHLESTKNQTVKIDELGLSVDFRAGERIHTENSYKFTPAMTKSILDSSGFALERSWTDEKGWFALHLARVEG
ncbi:MAG TPA: L-histidine N(alpha)-methyltransferase [Terriglobales bacterium]|nr:L-histidine N(alpha)-methyltransferase [Terriglobales bacterium]